MRVRVPDRIRPILQKTEHLKSFGGVSAKEAYRRGWIERAAIERQFEAAEVQLGLADAILPPPEPAPPLSEDQLLQLAKRYLRDCEANARPIPPDEDLQQELQEALTDEAYHVGREAVK